MFWSKIIFQLKKLDAAWSSSTASRKLSFTCPYSALAISRRLFHSSTVCCVSCSFSLEISRQLWHFRAGCSPDWSHDCNVRLRCDTCSGRIISFATGQMSKWSATFESGHSLRSTSPALIKGKKCSQASLLVHDCVSFRVITIKTCTSEHSHHSSLLEMI